jgi:hypothetical protein
MFRLRFAALFGAAALGLVCGCISFSRPAFLDRLHGRNSADCCEAGAVPDDVAALETGPALAAPGGAPCATPTAPIPQGTMPDLTQPPRLVPEPQSPTAPYRPSAKFTKAGADTKTEK